MTDASEAEVLEMISATNMVQVEDDVRRQRLTVLSNDGQWPYLADLRVVQVPRGSEDRADRAELTQTTQREHSLPKRSCHCARRTPASTR